MAFVNRSGGRIEQSQTAGAPPMDWDPDDPDAVKVHYDVSGWEFDQRARLAEVLAEAGLPHGWDGDELVVPEAVEAAVDRVFELLEEELGPFAVAPDEGVALTEFHLDDWPAHDLGLLRSALVDGEIPHRWEGAILLVVTDADDVVDDLLDAIERGDIASFSDADDDAAPPDDALGRLFGLGDRLARDHTDASARRELFEFVPLLDARHAPFGVAVRTWGRVVEQANELVRIHTETPGDDDALVEGATALRDVTRPFV